MAVLLDTGVIYALADTDDRWHVRCLEWLRENREPLLVPLTVVPEAGVSHSSAPGPEGRVEVCPIARAEGASGRGSDRAGPGTHGRDHGSPPGNRARRRNPRRPRGAAQGRSDRNNRPPAFRAGTVCTRLALHARPVAGSSQIGSHCCPGLTSRQGARACGPGLRPRRPTAGVPASRLSSVASDQWSGATRLVASLPAEAAGGKDPAGPQRRQGLPVQEPHPSQDGQCQDGHEDGPRLPAQHGKGRSTGSCHDRLHLNGAFSSTLPD